MFAQHPAVFSLYKVNRKRKEPTESQPRSCRLFQFAVKMQAHRNRVSDTHRWACTRFRSILFNPQILQTLLRLALEEYLNGILNIGHIFGRGLRKLTSRNVLIQLKNILSKRRLIIGISPLPGSPPAP